MRSYFNRQYIDFPIPNPIDIQVNSFKDFLENGIKETLREVGKIHDNTGRNWSIEFTSYRVDKPNRTATEAIRTGLTYDAPWYLTILVKNELTGQTKTKDIYMGDLPLMTDDGIFVVNGVSKVVITQLTRSQGVIFTEETDKLTGVSLPFVKILPTSGVWIDIETSKNKTISVRIDRKRKMPVTVLLKIFGLDTEQKLLKAFSESEKEFIMNTLEKDPSNNYEEAAVEIYKKLRVGDPIILESAKSFIDETFFNVKRYNLGKVGRFKLNMKLGTDFPVEEKNFVLQQKDLVEIIKYVIHLYNKDEGYFYDDIDSLANRRIRLVGELLQSEMRYGLYQIERIVKEKMALQPREILPDIETLISHKPVSARIISYLASGQLSQLLGMYNPLDSLDHKRRLSVMGKGGLTKERASYAVRDAHPTHYGKIDCVRTPEGQNVGLVTYLAIYARSNEFGFLETPYIKLEKKEDGKVRLTKDVKYLAAYDEEITNILGGNVEIDEKGYIIPDKAPMRKAGRFYVGDVKSADYIEIAPQQILGVSTALIPFIAHDDVARALIASQQSSQAVPLVAPETPIVGTGLESYVAQSSNLLLTSEIDGVVDYVDASMVKIKGAKGEVSHNVMNFELSNKGSCYTQTITVSKGQKVRKGDVLAEGPCSQDGELALGVNLKAAFMTYEGYNYEDAFIISSRLVEEDVLSSINITDYSVSVLETKLGPEEVTNDIPNVPETSLRHLDNEGIVLIGSKVKAGDILVGKIAPKGQSELSAEERLLRAVFGERVRDVRDNSLRLPHGRSGVVIDVSVLTPRDKEKMTQGVIKEITVKVAEYRKITVGDKLSGRHGQKGVIAKIVPKEDMPHLEDGSPMDVIISPTSILGRMNIGSILESHLGWAGKVLNKNYAIPAFVKINQSLIENELKEAGLPLNGKTRLIDGKTGEYYNQDVTVGYAYTFKLHHMAEDKMHARSTGPYALITQQPLGGKAQFGGQRFGEMEVWALEAYGVANSLHEILTIKSDDLKGRFSAFQAIIKGLPIPEPHVPESLKLMVRQLNGLCIAITPIARDNLVVEASDIDTKANEKIEENTSTEI